MLAHYGFQYKCFVEVLVHFSFFCLSACFIKAGRQAGTECGGSGEENQGGSEEESMNRMYYIKKNINKKLCQSALMLLSKYLHFKIVKFMNMF